MQIKNHISPLEAASNRAKLALSRLRACTKARRAAKGGARFRALLLSERRLKAAFEEAKADLIRLRSA